MTAFASLVEPRGRLSSHTLAKQLYWPVGDDPLDDTAFHLLAPLYASSLAHRVFETLQDDRFSDAAKAAREARKANDFSERPVREYPQLAVQQLGGTKPQNISQLNSERRGNNSLLASLPPVWRSADLQPLLRTDSMFHRYSRRPEVRQSVKQLLAFLKADAKRTMETRAKRAAWVNLLIDEFLQFTAELSKLEPGWSQTPACQLATPNPVGSTPKASPSPMLPWSARRPPTYPSASAPHLPIGSTPSCATRCRWETRSSWHGATPCMNRSRPKNGRAAMPNEQQVPDATPNPALLVLPRLRVQNANAISSPLTWGFPSITAFTGFMTALARRLGEDAGIRFQSVGVICHGFEAQVTQGGYTRSFCLTRNPVLQDGTTAAIVEEGRVHLDITLVFEVRIGMALLDDAARAECAARIGDCVAGMRIAGGSVMPPLARTGRRPALAQLKLLADETTSRAKAFKRLCRQWLPGFALVSRDDVLQQRLETLRANASPDQPQPSLLDAWLDLSRINHRATIKTEWNEATGAAAETVEWATDQRPGWLVPIPVGYAALSELHPSGAVAGARDTSTPFQFVESVYSIGQWISPHRLDDVAQLTWRTEHTPATSLYRCTNAYQAPAIDNYTPVTFID